MAGEYLSTDPNAGATHTTQYLSTDPNAGQTGPANQDPEFMDGRAQKLKGASGGDSAVGFIGGNLNLGMAGLAGMPVDFTRNLINLGIAGYGTAKGAMGGQPPDLIPNSSPGGGEWMQQQMRKVPGAVPPSATPQSPGGEYAAAALQMAPAGMVGQGGKNIGQAAVKAARGMVPAAVSGVTSKGASDAFGPEYAGPGAMLPSAKGIAKPPTVSERATAGRTNENFAKAKEMGIPVPPREMKADPRQQSIQDVVNRELGQPPGTEISPKTLQAYRNSYVGDYTAAFKSPALEKGVMPNKRFQDEIKKMGDEISAPRKDMPETFKGMEGVIKLLKEYGYSPSSKAKSYAGIEVKDVPGIQREGKPIKPDNAMRAIKKFRADANANFTSDKPEKVELARVQRKLANSLEQLVEDNLQDYAKRFGPQRPKLTEETEKFRTARTNMAKSHDVEDSLDPTTRQVSAQRASRLFSGGRPMTGELKNLAEVGGQFPGATKTPAESDLFSKKMSPFGVTHPGAVAAHAGTKMLDPITMSKPYQSMFVDPANKPTPEQLRRLRYFLGGQAATQGQIPQPPQQ
jgi:hypothetical protein